MVKVLKKNNCVRKYKMLEEISRGNFALSFVALREDGSKVFFKQYKSPSTEVAWYKEFVKYQGELRDRLKNNHVQRLALEFLDSFEERFGPLTFFQVFQFYDGKDMKSLISEFRSRKGAVTWANRVSYAKVFLAGLAMLHEAHIVHCDLKPENIYMVRDDAIEVGYRVKLIDMDFSILTGRPAPWHGHEGYVGTPNYQSPEHLTAAVPSPESDVFTAALILHELLGEGHPYANDKDYEPQVKAHSAASIRLEGRLATPEQEKHLAELIGRALHPHSSMRPTAHELHQALLRVPPAPTVPKVPVLRLVHEKTGNPLEIRVSTTELGYRNCKPLMNDEARFMDEIQFIILSRGAGVWAVKPALGTRNETLLNRKRITTETLLKQGDILAVGQEATGKEEARLKVEME